MPENKDKPRIVEFKTNDCYIIVNDSKKSMGQAQRFIDLVRWSNGQK